MTEDEHGFDVKRGSDWRELSEDPLYVEDILEGVSPTVQGNAENFMRTAYRYPCSAEGNVADALVDMGEKIEAEPENGTGVMGDIGVLYFFEEGELVAKKTTVRSRDFADLENRSCFGRYYEVVDRGELGDLFSVMESVDGIGVRYENEDKDCISYNLEADGRELASLYNSLATARQIRRYRQGKMG